MEWFVYAIVASVFMAVSSIVDKVMFNRYKHDPFSYQVIIAVTALPMVIGYLFFARPVVDTVSLIAVAVGVMVFFAVTRYNKCMKREEASRVIALTYLQPIIILLLGFIILGESGSATNILGILLLMVSAILISYKKTGKGFRISGDVLTMMVAYDILIGFRVIVVRWATGLSPVPHSPLDILFWILCGEQLAAYALLLASKNTRTAFVAESKRMGVDGWSFRGFGSVIDILGSALLYVALSLHGAAEVSAITAMQPFLVFVFSVALFEISHNTIHEDLRKASLIQKIAAFALIILGSWLVVA